MITSNTSGVGRDMTFLLIFGVFPATALMIGGGYVGGWVLGEDRMPWAAFAVFGGVSAAFFWILFCARMMHVENDRRSEERMEQIIKEMGLE